MFEGGNVTSGDGRMEKRAFWRVFCVLRAFVLFIGCLPKRRAMAAELAAFIVTYPEQYSNVLLFYIIIIWYICTKFKVLCQIQRLFGFI